MKHSIKHFLTLSVIAISLQATAQDSTCTDPDYNRGDIGCVTFIYRGQSVTYSTVRAGDGNIWLQQNLGAVKVADSSADADAYGHLFQWGRWDDGHQLRTSNAQTVMPSVNNPSGLGSGTTDFYTASASPRWWQAGTNTDTWNAATPAEVSATNGCDPCKVLGGEWHVPTTAEWTAVVSSESINNPATAFASSLKLPASGVRQTSNAFDFVGLRGYFWSSDPSNTAGWGKYCYVGTSTVTPGSGSYRGQGAAIRCMKLASALPVTWKTFTANWKETGKSVLLQWETTTEINNSYYNIQRSYNGTQYENIGKVAATNNATGSNYQYTDATVANNNVIWYRLQQVGKDGKYSYSNVVRLTADNIAPEIIIAPNPAKDHINFITSGSINNATVIITDMQGRTLLQQKGLQPMNVNTLSTGTYSITIETTKGTTTLRLIKQ